MGMYVYLRVYVLRVTTFVHMSVCTQQAMSDAKAGNKEPQLYWDVKNCGPFVELSDSKTTMKNTQTKHQWQVRGCSVVRGV
jgi:hypothetical protein